MRKARIRLASILPGSTVSALDSALAPFPTLSETVSALVQRRAPLLPLAISVSAVESASGTVCNNVANGIGGDSKLGTDILSTNIGIGERFRCYPKWRRTAI